jgi:hypothetical protein
MEEAKLKAKRRKITLLILPTVKATEELKQPAPATFRLFSHQNEVGSRWRAHRCSAPGSQNSQQGETLCSEFGKHR